MLKLAHAGLFCTEKASVMPLGPLAEGRNEYALPARSVVGGVPEIVGGGCDAVAWLASTWMLKAGRVALFQPSLTAITILE